MLPMHLLGTKHQGQEGQAVERQNGLHAPPRSGT